SDSVELKLAHYLSIPQDMDVMDRLKAAGIFSEEKIGLEHDASPAFILETILKKVWTLDPKDKDMIVMWHKFGYTLNGVKHKLESSMVCIGDDMENTAMAKTVGLPLAIATRMMINGRISQKGVIMPLKPEAYNSILDELAENGIQFTEKEIEL
ncbi:MAG: saccharopine dehydrogenase-like NADP-dependent oxidoreductase, partial [Bacteroidia bacterium]